MMMKLDTALRVLTHVHTRDDREVGFTVEMSAPPETMFSRSDYIEAWGVVRRHLRLETLAKDEVLRGTPFEGIPTQDFATATPTLGRSALMDDFTRRRLDQLSEYTPEQLAQRILTDLHDGTVSEDWLGAKPLNVLALVCLETAGGKVVPCIYNCGFATVAEQVGYAQLLMDKLLRYWWGEDR